MRAWSSSQCIPSIGFVQQGLWNASSSVFANHAHGSAGRLPTPLACRCYPLASSDWHRLHSRSWPLHIHPKQGLVVVDLCMGLPSSMPLVQVVFLISTFTHVFCQYPLLQSPWAPLSQIALAIVDRPWVSIQVAGVRQHRYIDAGSRAALCQSGRRLCRKMHCL